ncbi:MAG: hypothetical protein WAP03_27095 [Methylorubrum rhodinum]|uniref:hypothetical protein n=1 Tax=Methylorubrum rhodinum TaxID=29428 RepID=UPI003BAE9B27
MAYTVSGPSHEAIRQRVAAALSPERRRFAVTRAARAELARVETLYREELGRDPQIGLVVDGQPRRDLDRLDPDQGEIRFAHARAAEALAWIYEQLVTHSPRVSGTYASSHVLLADDREVDPTNAPPADRYVFASTSPYARKIEGADGRTPQSRQAPRGVYQAVAVMAARRFGNSVEVGFGYESPVLDYIDGEHGRGSRKWLKRQPLRRAAMRLERRTRIPVIVVVLR